MERKVCLIDLPLAKEIDFNLHKTSNNDTIRQNFEETEFWTNT